MKDRVDLSVIIPNFNNAHRLSLVLRALASQRIDKHIEVIVVDNGSDDESAKVAGEHGAAVIKYTDHRNPYACRNRGMAISQGRYILLLDATCVPANDQFLNTLLECATHDGTDLAVGKISFEFSGSPGLGQITDSIMFIGNDEGGSERKDYPAGVMLFSRHTLDAVGYFREDLRSGADDEWTRRLAIAGLAIEYCADAEVKYPARNFWPLMKKALRTGKGHHVLLKETREYSPIQELLRMRPPSPKYLDDIIEKRGGRDFRKRKVGLVFSVWAYRVALGWGRLFG